MDAIRKRRIDGPEAMITAVRELGIVPFFKNPVAGWSIEEMTAPGCWWDTEGVLGPWDWKIEVVHDGIAYGKLVGDRAAFATEEWYRELMNYRRSLPKYRIALGEKPRGKASTKHEKLMRLLAPIALDAIQQNGALEAKRIRAIMSEKITPGQIRTLGATYKPLLSPVIKKSISDSVMTFLQMGTWCVVGDLQRVHRGPNLVYSGWQTSTNVTPEEFWGQSQVHGSAESAEADTMPAWARRFMEEEAPAPELPKLGTPEESRRKIIAHIHSLFPETDPALIEKMI